MVAIDGGQAVLETPFGRLTGRSGADLAVGTMATLFLRPERLRTGPPPWSAQLVRGTLERTEFEGAATTLFASAADGIRLVCQVASHAAVPPATGTEITFFYAPSDALVLAEQPA